MPSKIEGIREMRRDLRRAPEMLRERVADAIRETVDAVHRRGRENIASMVERRTGLLAQNYRKRVSRQSLVGRVGYLSRKSQAETFYARFVNDGTRRAEARPFHTEAVEAERERDLQRMIDARDAALRPIYAARLRGRRL